MINEVLSNAEEIKSDSKDTKNTIDFQESKENESLVKKLMGLFKKAKAHRERYDHSWIENYRFFRGHQWTQTRPSFKHSEVINLIAQTIQSQVPIFMDRRPRIAYSPEEPSDLHFAKVMDKVAEADWIRKNWVMILTEIAYDMFIYGTGLGTVVYDEDEDNGIGGIKFESVDPVYFFPDPEAKDVNRCCRYIVNVEPMDLEKVKKKWPKGKYVRPDISEDRDERQNLTTRFSKSIDSNLVSHAEKPNDESQRNKVLVMTFCLDLDDDYEEKEEKDETGQSKRVRVKKYPKGRKVVIANNIVLEDKHNQYEDRRFPFARLQNYILSREFWGISEIENLKKPQMMFNKLVSFAMDVLTYMGNPIWVIDSTSGIDPENITNAPGLVLEKNPNSEARRVEGTHLQPYVLQIIDRLKEYVDGISGANDVTRGAAPTGVSAASAIQELREAAHTRIRQKARQMDCFLQDIGQMYLSRVLQYYNQPRIIKITNDQQAAEYFKFQIENYKDENGEDRKKAIVMPVRPNMEAPGQTIEGNISEYPIKGSFDVRVDTGSSLPFSKIENQERALLLYDRQIIDAEEVLNAIDYPNKEKVLQRMMQQQQAMAQAQMQQGTTA